MFAAKFSDSIHPPKNGWLKSPLTVQERIFPGEAVKISEKKIANHSPTQSVVKVDVDGGAFFEPVSGSEEEIRFNDEILHPDVGERFGKELQSIYLSTSPFYAITIDGLLDSNKLRKGLEFKSVPLPRWEGPETAAGCCKEKYRLGFDEWMTNKWAKAIKALAYNPRFVSFLEAMTGISGLFAMKATSSNYISHGSSLIAIQNGGYLDIHNDVSSVCDRVEQ